MRVLVTGGAGFIGTNFVHYWFEAYPGDELVVLDKLTYAGNRDNLAPLEGDARFRFVQGDVCDPHTVQAAMDGCQWVVHFAAETHVDRSILSGGDFIQTDVYGTWVMLETARRQEVERFVQISTDEVYGSIPAGRARETDPLMPSSPYAASKTGADRLAFSYFVTYDLPVIITRAANNYGPYQYPEKLLPFFTTNALQNQPLPVYGSGRNTRDWLYVLDHCLALDHLLRRGTPGEAYNIGAGNERSVLQITRLILDELGLPDSLIRFVEDRPGHDLRYAVDCSRLQALGWEPQYEFEPTMRATIRWYRDHREWWEQARARSRDYFERWYRSRLQEDQADAPAGEQIT